MRDLLTDLLRPETRRLSVTGPAVSAEIPAARWRAWRASRERGEQLGC